MLHKQVDILEGVEPLKSVWAAEFMADKVAGMNLLHLGYISFISFSALLAVVNIILSGDSE